MRPALLAFCALAVIAACSPVDTSRPGCRAGSTYRADILPMLDGQCPTRAQERQAADYEIRTWDLDCRGACAVAGEMRGYTMLLNQSARPLPMAPPRLLPVPMR